MARQRSKDFFPIPTDFETISIESAYSELSRRAFAVWIRLMAEPKGSLKNIGVKTFGKKVALSRRAVWYAMCELRDAGYLRIVAPTRVGAFSEMYATKRPSVSTHSHFVRI